MSNTQKKMKEEFERDIRDAKYLEQQEIMRPNSIQVGGDHYKKSNIQAWDFIHENGIGFIAGNIIKYIVRYNSKNGVEDLKKARHYLDKLIELEE